jgi:hypothetical protein
MMGALAWWSVFTIAAPFSARLTCGHGSRRGADLILQCQDGGRLGGAGRALHRLYSLGGEGELLGPGLGALSTGWITMAFGWRWSFVLFGLSQLLSTVRAGVRAVSVFDLSSSRARTGTLYGFFNSSRNLMAAANSLVITLMATHLGFPTAFGGAVLFMMLFIASMLLVVDRPGYEQLLRTAQQARQVDRALGNADVAHREQHYSVTAV